MTRDEAIIWVREIQGGSGLYRMSMVDEIPRGEIAVRCWYDPMFKYGMEYGVILALMTAFNIKRGEL